VGLLGGEVEGAELVGALEQHVLEVVREAGGGGGSLRLPVRTAIQALKRGFSIGADVDGEAVLEAVDRDAEGVVREGAGEEGGEIGGGEDRGGVSLGLAACVAGRRLLGRLRGLAGEEGEQREEDAEAAALHGIWGDEAD
jgi:hypothetical protein